MRFRRRFVAFCCLAFSIAPCASTQAPDIVQALRAADALEKQGRYAEALPLYRTALNSAVKQYGNQHPNVADILQALGTMSLHQRNYDDAVNYFRVALAIREKALGPENPTTGETVSGIGTALEGEGRSAEAIQQYTRAFTIFAKSLGPEDLRTAREGLRAGTLMIDSANLGEGCPTVMRAQQILESKLGAGSPEVANALTQVGNCLHYDRKNEQAEAAFRRALAIEEKNYGPDHRLLTGPLTYLASLLHDQGKFAEADPFYRRALAIAEKTLGPDSSNTSEIALGLAVNYYGWGKPELAAPLYERRLQAFAREIASGGAYMSERDRLAFLHTSAGLCPLYFSFVYANPSRPGLAGKMYDLLVNERGLAAGNAAALRARIFASGDRQAQALLDQLRVRKTQLSTIVTSAHGDPAEFNKNITLLTAQVNDIEESLARRAASLPPAKAAPAPNWRDIARALQPGEAAVEYVRFHFHDGRTFTNTWNYAALVLTRDSEPRLIPLGDALAAEKTVYDLFTMQSAPTRGVSKAVAPAVSSGPDCYNVFWKLIEPALAGAKRVYVAGDAVLNQFPIGLFADASGRLLMERYDLRLLNSTKDLLLPQARANSKTAVLVGNAAFDLGLPAGGKRSLAALPATQDEVEAVAKTFRSAGWEVQTLTGGAALKEAVLRQSGPRVLHLATHGFFVSTSSLERDKVRRANLDEMLQSGLFFAGANRTLSGGAPVPGKENGILTSYEAAQLNLEGSELVVLSACETARGQQGDNGEGVFGLRRALQEAGAQAILMSSWSVPDRETQELMALFYQKWLAGADKHEALRQAQLEERAAVRQRYGKDLPFYWGAFVLVGR